MANVLVTSVNQENRLIRKLDVPPEELNNGVETVCLESDSLCRCSAPGAAGIFWETVVQELSEVLKSSYSKQLSCLLLRGHPSFLHIV
jgi:hypothetical protein